MTKVLKQGTGEKRERVQEGEHQRSEATCVIVLYQLPGTRTSLLIILNKLRVGDDPCLKPGGYLVSSLSNHKSQRSAAFLEVWSGVTLAQNVYKYGLLTVANGLVFKPVFLIYLFYI